MEKTGFLQQQCNLSGRRALVCGSSQGIGAVTAQMLAEMGAEVCLLARDQSKLEVLLKELPGKGHSAIAIDLANTTELENQIKKQISTKGFDILINNSGGPKSGALIEADPAELTHAFQAHVIAAQTLAKHLVPGMKASKYGRIINIISTSVKTPLANLGVSNTIRAAMANWAKTLAGELGPAGITVNNVLPGYTLTTRLESLKKNSAQKMGVSEQQIENTWKDSIPLRRFAQPSEVAAAICFLASPAASYISGINLPVDGGRTQSL